MYFEEVAMKSRSPTAVAPSPVRPSSILIVDDHPLIRSGLTNLIGRCSDLSVAGEAGSPSEALQALGRGLPDLMLADMTMPGRSGFEFIKDVLAQYPDLPILVLSMHDEGLYGERVLRAGARGYIMKDAGGERLIEAIRQVLSGQVYVSPAMASRFLDTLSGRRPRGSSSPIEVLSDREFEVLQLLGLGKTTRDIAEQLHLSPKTVDVHRAHIRTKLKLRDSVALVRYAVRWVESQGATEG